MAFVANSLHFSSVWIMISGLEDNYICRIYYEMRCVTDNDLNYMFICILSNLEINS